tara:strand:+ start:277 stop:726 length:450 start_codon:yes stop_codon:yes gene_type:complete
MDKFINNELIYSVVNYHIGHFLNVKKLVKHDYESHMILLTVYTHFLFQTMSKGKSLDWTETFAATETEGHKQLMRERKLTIFAVAENLSIPQETVRRKLKKLCSRKLLEYSKTYGLSLGKKFKETIEPVGKADGQDIFALLEKFKKAKG